LPHYSTVTIQALMQLAQILPDQQVVLLHVSLPSGKRCLPVLDERQAPIGIFQIDDAGLNVFDAVIDDVDLAYKFRVIHVDLAAQLHDEHCDRDDLPDNGNDTDHQRNDDPRLPHSDFFFQVAEIHLAGPLVEYDRAKTAKTDYQKIGPIDGCAG